MDGSELTCVKCGQVWEHGGSAVACPKCGGNHFSVTIHETIGRQYDSMFARGTDADTGKVILKAKSAYEETRTGPTAGSPALVEQTVNRTQKPAKYRKKVTLSDGRVVKDVEGPLSDPKMHGPQQDQG